MNERYFIQIINQIIKVLLLCGYEERFHHSGCPLYRIQVVCSTQRILRLLFTDVSTRNWHEIPKLRNKHIPFTNPALQLVFPRLHSRLPFQGFLTNRIFFKNSNIRYFLAVIDINLFKYSHAKRNAHAELLMR